MCSSATSAALHISIHLWRDKSFTRRSYALVLLLLIPSTILSRIIESVNCPYSQFCGNLLSSVNNCSNVEVEHMPLMCGVLLWHTIRFKFLNQKTEFYLSRRLQTSSSLILRWLLLLLGSEMFHTGFFCGFLSIPVAVIYNSKGFPYRRQFSASFPVSSFNAFGAGICSISYACMGKILPLQLLTPCHIAFLFINCKQLILSQCQLLQQLSWLVSTSRSLMATWYPDIGCVSY